MNIIRRALVVIFVFQALLFSQGAYAGPESGWWWNPAEPGRGFSIEIQNGYLFISGQMYDDTGKAVWYTSGPKKLTGEMSYHGYWQQTAGGQTLNGTYKAASVVSSNVGYFSIYFDGPTSGTMELANGTKIQLKRYTYGVSGPTSIYGYGSYPLACTSSNLTTAKYNQLTPVVIGMTLEQVSNFLGCSNSPELTSWYEVYVTHTWKVENSGARITWIFDPTGKVVQPWGASLGSASNLF